MSCVIPANQPIHDAMTAKAASYPADQPFKSKAYKAAAEKLRTLDLDLFANFGSGKYYDALDGFGQSTGCFIDDYIVARPQNPAPTWEQPWSGTVPANKPIYDALLAKAASYPADKPYQAKAYKKAAETVFKYTTNIYDEFAKYNAFCFPPANIGTSIEEFIYKFIKDSTTKPAEPVKPVVVCKHANNGPLYKALINKAASYPKDELYKARHYTTAAEKVKDHVYSIQTQYSLTGDISGFGGPSVTSFIERFVCDPDSIKTELAASDPARTLTEDEMIVATLGSICAKKGWKFNLNLVADYKKWRANLSSTSYYLEKYDYKTGKFVPRTPTEIVEAWTLVSEDLQEQQRQILLRRAIPQYCKKNNIELKPEFEEHFAAWMKDPANKKLIVSTYTSGGCCGDHAVTTKEYKKSPYTCVSNWFRGLKKTVVF